MDTQEFLFWLKGIIEFNDELSKEQVQKIKEELEKVKTTNTTYTQRIPFSIPNSTPDWTVPFPVYCKDNTTIS